MASTIVGLGALERRLAAISGPQMTTQIAKDLGLRTVRNAKLVVRRKTGNLGRSIHVESATPQQVKVVASASYAGDIEFGTRPHEITPRAAKALFFVSQKATTARFGAGAQLKFNLSGSMSAASTRKYGNAAYVHAKVVHHPGTKPYPFLLPGAKKAVVESGLLDVVVQRWNAAA